MSQVFHKPPILGLCLMVCLLAGAGPATRPAGITLSVTDTPAREVLMAIEKQLGTALTLHPADLLQQNQSIPRVTLEVKRQPFWRVLEQMSRQTGIEPIANPDSPMPRFQLGLGRGEFWKEPHAVAGPLILFATDVSRSVTVELGPPGKHQQERALVLNFSAMVEPQVRVLSAWQSIKINKALDENGLSLLTDVPQEAPEFGGADAGQLSWTMSADLQCPAGAGRRIAALSGRTALRIQVAGQRVEFDEVMKARTLTRTVGGIPVTLKSLKKDGAEYIAHLILRRARSTEQAWNDLHHSISSGAVALLDSRGRTIAARGFYTGGDFGPRINDASLRFTREPGATDPEAGEPHKLVWEAPVEARDLLLEFEMGDIPIPQ